MTSMLTSSAVILSVDNTIDNIGWRNLRNLPLYVYVLAVDIGVFNCFNVSLESFDGVGIVEQSSRTIVNAGFYVLKVLGQFLNNVRLLFRHCPKIQKLFLVSMFELKTVLLYFPFIL